ncbi:MAG: DNA polymerase-1 [Myxococcota bacterium]|jgi:DNA polymerase-1
MWGVVVAAKKKQAATAEKAPAEKTPASKSKGKVKSRLVIIDGANAIFRAFFGIPGLRGPDGSPTNAVLGFTNILNKILRDEKPDYIAVAMDPKGGSFRNELYPEYKANRDAMPEDLSVQFPLVKELIDAYRIPRIEIPGFEADDVIATVVKLAPDDVAVSIISTDKDLMQLCSETVELVDGIKDRRFGPAEVVEKFGVPPEQMLDLRALVGDPSDNIPGVKGIGVKGAAKLIEEYETLENLLANAPDVKAKRAREGLIEHADLARLSKELSTLREDVELGIEIEGLAKVSPDNDALRELFTRLGFTRLLEGLEAGGNKEAGAGSETIENKAPEAVPEIEIVTDAAKLSSAIKGLAKADDIVALTVDGGGSAVDALIVGIALAQGSGQGAVYVPVAGVAPAQADLLLDEAEEPALALDVVLDALSSLFIGKDAKPWFGWHTKRVQSAFAENGLNLAPPSFDVRIGAFLLDPAGSHDLSPLAMQFLGTSVTSWEDIAGRGAKAVPAGDLKNRDVADWCAQQLLATASLRGKISDRLATDGLTALFEDVELPLTAVLSRMERSGVRIDEKKLAALSVEYESILAMLEKEIYKLAGEEFLVSSPKQLQVILFEKLRLTPIKKTKTGYSTAESVLEQLASEHELPGKILHWRQLSKLKSTYIDALPKLVSAKTGRIHPSFNQIGAATGRLSASDPNVQNIPIRTSEGVRIRETFIPDNGDVMLAADYSQVELRILAHYSKDESLVDAFMKGEDVHRRTAAEVAGISVDEVDNDQRARAKAVNFGIIYGSSAFGLANNLGIATGEAQEIVDAYFARYIGVRRFLDETVENAKSTGFVTTYLGRRRYLPDLGSKNRMLKQAAERMAVNTVVQGTAADLIKKAMIEVDQELRLNQPNVTMTMQVHDELVFEVPKDDVEALSSMVREKMQGVFDLEVPLVVDIGTGKNWREAH